MKRKNEKVPGFDEIIFENRNKNYGAYDLRKNYKSATSYSILGAIALGVLIMAGISLTTEKGTASTGPNMVIIEIADPVIPEKVRSPEIKPPAELVKTINNIQPVVITDTLMTTSYLPITEDIIDLTEDRNISDTITYTDLPDPVISDEPAPRIFVEEMPEYPGGNFALLKFISENIDYPSEAIVNNIQGRVILKFVVNTDGSVDRIEVIRSIDPLLDTEAIRVVGNLQRFKPGKQAGVPVPVWFSLPVLFKLNNN